MNTRLTSNALILSGVETVKGEGAAVYQLLIAETASNIAVTSETVTAQLINPNFGGEHKIPTKKATNVGLSLLPLGKGTGTTPDIHNFLEASAIPQVSTGDYFVVPLSDSVTNVSGIETGVKCNTTAPDPADPWQVVGISTKNLVIKSSDGTSPAVGSVLLFEGTVTSVTTHASKAPITVTDRTVYGLTSKQDDHSSISVQFFYDDLLYQSNGLQGGITWSFSELPRLMFEGTGTYITPVDNQTTPSVNGTECGDSLMLDNLGLTIDGIAIEDNSCFESLELKTNVTQVKPTIPSETCNNSVTTDVQPTFNAVFTQLFFSKYPVYEHWENGKKVNIVVEYGDGTTGRNFIICMKGCSLDAAPAQTDVNGVLHTSTTFNVTKPCGISEISNLVIINY